MSQKKEVNVDQPSSDHPAASADKWRELAGRDVVEDEQLLSDEMLSDEPENADNKLRDQLKIMQIQLDFQKDQATRAHAELENVRRRAEQDVSKARKFGVERMIAELIPVVDSLVRGLEGVNATDASMLSMKKGMELTLDMLHKLLEKNGVLPIDPKSGDTFDPALHEAMSMRSEPDTKANVVLQVLQKGYSLHGRVIRAAMVIVSA